MINDDDMIIRKAARSICAAQSDDADNALDFLAGELDNSVWMAIVEQGIRRGIQIGRSL